MRSRSKYGNRKTEVDGIVFQSKREAVRYIQLKMLEKAKAISGLQRQVTYRLDVNGKKVCKYIADFVYFEGGKQVVEDVKGVVTEAFRLKSKLMAAVHNIDILVTK